MIFQHLALFPHLTVAENIAFGLEMKKVARNVIREKVKNALELVRLPDYGQRRIDMLSGGQKQRVAMARALVNEPDVLLLDEPLGALDMRLRLQMQEELRRLHRATRKTFIFVTHDQGEAMTMSDRIAVMSGGHIIQVGTPREVYEQPKQKFVAQFLGSSNWLVGKITAINADRTGTIDVNGRAVGARIPAGLQTGTEVALVLRYEKVDVLPESSPAMPGDLEGVITAEIFMGSTVRYEITVTGGLNMISDMPNSGKTSDLAPERRVRVRWPLHAAIVLAE
jgi:spermidine/putrescine transport system ATP-binding protein